MRAEGLAVDQVGCDGGTAVVMDVLNEVQQFSQQQIKILLRYINKENKLLHNLCHRNFSCLFSAEPVDVDEIYKRLKLRIIISFSASASVAATVTTQLLERLYKFTRIP